MSDNKDQDILDMVAAFRESDMCSNPAPELTHTEYLFKLYMAAAADNFKLMAQLEGLKKWLSKNKQALVDAGLAVEKVIEEKPEDKGDNIIPFPTNRTVH